jgi:hypothetical protein
MLSLPLPLPLPLPHHTHLSSCHRCVATASHLVVGSHCGVDHRLFAFVILLRFDSDLLLMYVRTTILASREYREGSRAQLLLLLCLLASAKHELRTDDDYSPFQLQFCTKHASGVASSV